MAFDEWMTPPDIIELARATMGSIDFDPASNIVAQEYVRAGKYCVSPTRDNKELNKDIFAIKHFSVLDGCLIDGLKQEWYGSVWLNPPYSRGNIDAFVDKALVEWNQDKDINLRKLDDGTLYVKQMMILVNSATDASWYHKLLNHSNVVLVFKGRIKFWKIFDGKAHKTWIGEKSKQDGTNKEGNSPRYLNTLFYFGTKVLDFKEKFQGKGTFLHVN